jgi:nitroreductase
MRRSIREFTPEALPLASVRAIVEEAGRAPSSKNTQPWQLCLAQGAPLEALRADMLSAFDAKEPPRFDYVYSKAPLPEAFNRRAHDLGRAFLAHKGIERGDKERRRLHDRENYAFFGAPQVFFLGVGKDDYGMGTLLDCGLFLESLIAALDSRGLGCCPQYSVMAYPDIISRHLGMEGTLGLLALPFGRPLPGSSVNQFLSEREPIDAFFRVVG